ncbi:hypothetical protein HHI36_015572, partial [Cryptolaemus montrouzieri]
MAQNTLATLEMEIQKRFQLIGKQAVRRFQYEQIRMRPPRGKKNVSKAQGCQKNCHGNKEFKKRRNEKRKEEPVAKRKRRSKTTPPDEKRTELTGKVMKEILCFIVLPFPNNPDDIQAMKKAIWARFYHRISTNEKPQHQYCDKSW